LGGEEVKKHRLLTIFGVFCLTLTLVALPVAGCAKPGGPIKVGIAAAQTGFAAPYWPGCQGVLDVVVEVINADPPLGRAIELVYDDAEGSIEGNIKVANYLGGQGVAYAVGYDSEGLWSALDVIERFGTPTFTHWAGTPKLDKTETGKKGLFYRTTSGDTIMYAMYGLYWKTELTPKGFKKAAILNDIGEASRGSAQVATWSFQRAGVDIVHTKEFSEDETTFSRILADAFAEKPDAIFFAGSPEQGTTAFKQWWDSALSKDIIWFVSDEYATAGVLDALTPAPGAFDDKMLGPNPATGEGLREFVGTSYDVMLAAFQKKHGAGTEPEHGFAINLWDAVIIGALAVEAAGDASPEAVAQKIGEVSSPPGVKVYSYAEAIKALREGKDIDFEGAGSLCNFDEWGNVYPPTGMYMVIKGNWEQIGVYAPEEIRDFIAR